MAQLTSDKITEIYCIADDFCKEFSKEFKKYQILPMMANGIEIAHLPCPMLKLLQL
jgi:hypothetical protein